MKRVLENEELRVEVSDLGAELWSLYDKVRGHEVLWQGDPVYWGRRSPILFPNVGMHYENECRYEGNVYKTWQHGFVRDMEFLADEGEGDLVRHSLREDERTLAYFPFPFELQVIHSLNGKALKVEWVVKNKGEKEMFFTIGGHPGFQVPVLPGTRQTDYFLTFEGERSLEYILVEPGTGNANPDVTYELELEEGRCPIKEELFESDALIFDHGQIKKVGIAYPDKTPYVAFHGEGFSNFGIWKAKDAPFICLEPWCGRCDDFGYKGDISEKPDVIRLRGGEVFRRSYEIILY